MSRTQGAKDKQPRKKAEVGNRPCDKSPVIQGQKAEIPQEYNARRIQFMLDIMPTEPLDKHDVAEMERRFMNYVKKCAEWGMKLGNMAAYLAIGITKDEAKDMMQATKSNPERALFIKKVKHLCGTYREGLMEDGKINPVTGIFWQKNYDGFKDEQELVVTPNNPLGEQTDPESLKQKYIDSSFGLEELPEHTNEPPES